MAEIKEIIVHCSDSPWGCAREIRKWHLERGWSEIGYHFVIQNGSPLAGMKIDILDGSVECGRKLDGDRVIQGEETGAHALGLNASSIGVCMIGTTVFSDKQMQTLLDLLAELCTLYHVDPDNVLGHYETAQAGGKTCPNTDMRAFREILKHELVQRRK